MDHSHDWIVAVVVVVCALVGFVSIFHGENLCRMLLWWIDERNKLKRFKIEKDAEKRNEAPKA